MAIRPLLALVALVATGCTAAGTGGAALPSGPSAGPSRQGVLGSASSPGVSHLRVSTAGWQTDFTKATIDVAELEPGGPPKDGIPAIDHPKPESIAAARRW